MPLWALAATLAVGFTATSAAAETRTASAKPFSREGPSVVRVMSWNVGKNSIFPPDGARRASFFRVVRALDPDVIGLQEVAPDGARQLPALLDSELPLPDGRSWSTHAISDNVLLSRHELQHRGGERVVRYPLPDFGLPDFHYGFAAAYVVLPESRAATGLYIVTMHNKSGAGDENVRRRQVQSDATVAWLREARGRDLPPLTPLVVMGDMNTVPGASPGPYVTLLSGDISDEDAFGPDQPLDWDGSDLSDPEPGLNGSRQTVYTWRDDRTEFPPSSLDRILFSDSVMSLVRAFVLDTTALSDGELEELGLERSDVLYGGEPGVYDHLPLVADFVLRPSRKPL